MSRFKSEIYVLYDYDSRSKAFALELEQCLQFDMECDLYLNVSCIPMLELEQCLQFDMECDLDLNVSCISVLELEQCLQLDLERDFDLGVS